MGGRRSPDSPLIVAGYGGVRVCGCVPEIIVITQRMEERVATCRDCGESFRMVLWGDVGLGRVSRRRGRPSARRAGYLLCDVGVPLHVCECEPPMSAGRRLGDPPDTCEICQSPLRPVHWRRAQGRDPGG